MYLAVGERVEFEDIRVLTMLKLALMLVKDIAEGGHVTHIPVLGHVPVHLDECHVVEVNRCVGVVEVPPTGLVKAGLVDHVIEGFVLLVDLKEPLADFLGFVLADVLRPALLGPHLDDAAQVAVVRN